MTWTRETVMTELTAIFGEYADAGAQIRETSHLVADLGVDSLGVFELIQNVEDKFGLEIPDEALHEVETVGDVAKAILARLEADGRLTG
jgi:acyl carrier protein